MIRPVLALALLSADARAAIRALPSSLKAPSALPASAAVSASPALASTALAAPAAALAAALSPAAAPAAAESAAAPAAEAAHEGLSARFDGTATAPARDAVIAPSADGPRLNLQVKTFKLDNGLTVVVRTDKKSPVVGVSITYKVGSRHESRKLAGFAHLFEHLMAQGTKSIKPREISQIIESAGGVRNANTSKSNTTYYSVVPKSALKTVLWAEAERMSTLDVDERALAMEQQVVLEEMRLRYTNAPYVKAQVQHLAEAVFDKWENRHTTIGEADDIRGARLEDVREFYRTHYAPNNAVLAIDGDVSEAEARELVQRYFGAIPSKPAPPAAQDDEPAMTKDRRVVVQDKFAKVPMLMTAWRAPKHGSKDYWALMTLEKILNAGEASPLHEALVKSARLALGASANFPWYSSYISPGGPDVFGIAAHLKPGASADAVLALIDGVLARFASEGPGAAQLAAAKTSLEREWNSELVSASDRVEMLSKYGATVGDPSGLVQDFAALMSVTAQDVKDAVSRWLRGPRGVVEAVPAPQLELAADPKTPPIPAARPRGAGDPRPAADPQAPFPLPAVERFTLSNGAKVVFVKDSRLPLLQAQVEIPGGRLAERPGEEGLAAAVSELMLKGAGGLDAAGLSARIQSQGWGLRTGGGREGFSFTASGLARNAGKFLETLGAVLAAPAYPESELALWKENKVQELKIERSKPSFMAAEKVKEAVFGAHPYGRPAPSDAQIAAITREKVLEFHRRALAAEGASLVLVGDADPAELRAQLERGLSSWRSSSERRETPPLPAPKPGALHLVAREGSPQANILVAQAIALKPGDEDWLAFTVANHILGGSATSRLFVNLRVQKGYTYGAYSGAEPLRRGSLWTANTEVRNEVVAPSVAELKKEIARLRDEAVPAETLESVKKYLAGIFLLKNSSLDYLAGSLASYERNGQSAEQELSTYLQRLNALTPADIQRAARRYLDPEAMQIVVVGDQNALQESLVGPTTPAL